jgi:flagellar hook-associated protein 3 FlgL
MVERLSTNQVFQMFGGHIAANQKKLIDISKKINLNKKFTNPMEDPVGIVSSLQARGKMVDNDQSQRSRLTAKSELESAEVALSSMKDIMDRMKEVAITGGNDSLDADARALMIQEIRAMGNSIVQLANSKSGGKYIFSGEQSDVQTLQMSDGADFATAVYKNGQDNGKQRNIEGITSSVDAYNSFINTAQTASIDSKVISPILASSGTLDITVNDGSGNQTAFSVNLTAGDNLTTIITKINTAFTIAGGLGAIAQQSPANYLNLNTSLVTGNTPGEDAFIKILQSSGTNLTNELHIKKQMQKGGEQGMLRTISDLETAFQTDDTVTIRALLKKIDANIGNLISLRGEIGSTVKQVESLDEYSGNLNVTLTNDASIIEDLDFIGATQELSAAQVALQSSVQTTSSYFQQSLFRFLGGG